MKSFYIYCRPCPRRSLDATRLNAFFLENGLAPTGNPKHADLIVIYTCGGFSDTEERSIFTIKSSLKTNATIIITGCLPKIHPERIEIFKRAKIILVEDFSEWDSLINPIIPYSLIPSASLVQGVNDLLGGKPFSQIRSNFEFNREFVKKCVLFFKKMVFHGSREIRPLNGYYKLEIARGCLGCCTYCAIKLAMEKYHSLPLEKIVENFKLGLESGHSKFAVIAGDIGCYGIDIKSSLPILLEKLFAVDGNYKFLLVDLNPYWLKEYYSEFLRVLKANSTRIERIIIPIQSGSEKILKRMNRKYSVNDVKHYLIDMKRQIPEVELETHIIVGFPGETSEDFQKSADLLKEFKFASIQIYKYEDRPGTVASKMSNKVSEKTKKYRATALARQIRSNN